MHVLFVHKNFPAQFGHIASRLVRDRGWKCTFVSERPPGTVGGVDNIQYTLRGGATERTHYASQTFENAVWHASAVYEALRPVSAAVRPDLVVGHSGFGSTLFLRELYPDAPIINYFEYFYRARESDLDFRPDVPVMDADRLRSPARNAMILLDMEYCAAGYTPTRFQHGLMPAAYKDKIRVLHDGIDTEFWRPRALEGRRIGNLELEPGERLVTYVSRGLESMRGFDVFLRAAKRVYERFPRVKFVVVGENRVAYGGDERRTGGRSFRDWVLAQDEYDPSRILFVGRQPPDVLAELLTLSDLHVYLTVPFVLSWSLLDAMACGATVLASDTAPVREVVRHGENGLLTDFFDDEALAERAVEVLTDPDAFAHLGAAARRTVEEGYSLDRVLPEMAALYESVTLR